MMINKSELKELFSKEGINIYEVIATDNIYSSNALKLTDNSIDGLIDFININKITTVFYEYYYYNQEVYSMDFEEFEDISDEVMDVISDDVNEYNKNADAIDFSKPYILRIFCNYGSINVFVSIVDDWLANQGFLSAGEKLEELLDTYESRLDDIFSVRKERRDALFKELVEFIMNDPEFHISTNAKFRRSYLYKLEEREETQKFIEVIKDDDGYLNSKLYNLIEEIWRDYKLRIKK
jgi:hypothetical protein